MLDLQDRGGTPVGVLLNFANGGDVVRACLEFAWRLGVPWRPADDPASDQDLLDSRDRRILRLMANGVSDAAISRQLGISSRTVERRVRVIMDRVNATTRFQAGVLAARQGLI
nr:helix-turn-helix transcriptional regulator [Flexivirga aerilata]